MLEWDFNGLVETTVDDEYGWYYVKNGVIDWTYTGYINIMELGTTFKKAF